VCPLYSTVETSKIYNSVSVNFGNYMRLVAIPVLRVEQNGAYGASIPMPMVFALG